MKSWILFLRVVTLFSTCEVTMAYQYQYTTFGENTVSLSGTEMTSSGVSSLVFKVKGCKDAILYLSSRDSKYKYKIGIENGSGTFSKITKLFFGNESIVYKVVQNDTSGEEIIECYHFKTIWLLWDNNSIMVGSGADLMENMFMSGSDVDLIAGLRLLNIRSFGNTNLTWIFQGNDTNLSISELTSTSTQIDTTPSWMMTTTGPNVYTNDATSSVQTDEYVGDVTNSRISTDIPINNETEWTISESTSVLTHTFTSPSWMMTTTDPSVDINDATSPTPTDRYVDDVTNSRISTDIHLNFGGHTLAPSPMESSSHVKSASVQTTAITELHSHDVTTTSIMSTVETDKTSPKETTTTESMCQCSCPKYEQDLEIRLQQIRKSLLINKTNLTLNIRKKFSAPDSRVSSRYLGYLGIAVIVCVSMLILMADLTRVSKHYKK